MKNSQSGFTLIEILVVIGIISLLAVALLPQVIEGQRTANMAADEANLRWHFTTFTNYKTKVGRLPQGGGSKFILRPWVETSIEHTVENFRRYFSPQVTNDERKIELEEGIGVANIWKNIDEITSMDTSYAGRASKYKTTMESGNEFWMATDNENGNIYPDGTIIVLKGNGATEKLLRIKQLKEFFPEDDPDFVLEVGPDSPHEGLRKLER